MKRLAYAMAAIMLSMIITNVYGQKKDDVILGNKYFASVEVTDGSEQSIYCKDSIKILFHFRNSSTANMTLYEDKCFDAPLILNGISYRKETDENYICIINGTIECKDVNYWSFAQNKYLPLGKVMVEGTFDRFITDVTFTYGDRGDGQPLKLTLKQNKQDGLIIRAVVFSEFDQIRKTNAFGNYINVICTKSWYNQNFMKDCDYRLNVQITNYYDEPLYNLTDSTLSDALGGLKYSSGPAMKMNTHRSAVELGGIYKYDIKTNFDDDYSYSDTLTFYDDPSLTYTTSPILEVGKNPEICMKANTGWPLPHEEKQWWFEAEVFNPDSVSIVKKERTIITIDKNRPMNASLTTRDMETGVIHRPGMYYMSINSNFPKDTAYVACISINDTVRANAVLKSEKVAENGELKINYSYDFDYPFVPYYTVNDVVYEPQIKMFFDVINEENDLVMRDSLVMIDTLFATKHITLEGTKTVALKGLTKGKYTLEYSARQNMNDIKRHCILPFEIADATGVNDAIIDKNDNKIVHDWLGRSYGKRSNNSLPRGEYIINGKNVIIRK